MNHNWKVSRPCEGQMVISCDCGVEIWVCPCSDNAVIVHDNDASMNVKIGGLIIPRHEV
jgi:hypothetical protein